jgi:two-component system LytT family response regulator
MMFFKTDQFLSRKYPFFILDFKRILFLSIFIFSLMILLKPFGFENYLGNKLLAAIGFGIVSFLSLILNNFFIKKKLHKIGLNKWTVLNEIIYNLVSLTSISISNYLYYLFFVERTSFNFVIFIYFVFITCIIGSLPISFIVLIRHNYILKNKLHQIVGVEDVENENGDNYIKLSTLNKSEEEFSILIKEFLFLEVIKNHIHVYYIDNDSVKTKILRNTLTNIMEELQAHKNIFRCHRSYVLNLNNILSAKGNSNGYKIELRKHEHQVPLSRQYVVDFQKLFY